MGGLANRDVALQAIKYFVHPEEEKRVVLDMFTDSGAMQPRGSCHRRSARMESSCAGVVPHFDMCVAPNRKRSCRFLTAIRCPASASASAKSRPSYESPSRSPGEEISIVPLPVQNKVIIEKRHRVGTEKVGVLDLLKLLRRGCCNKPADAIRRRLSEPRCQPFAPELCRRCRSRSS